MRKSDWHNLYGESWTGIITSESFAHPAKFSRGLIRHIYQHLFDEGWLQPGDTVLDPFGGVALGALHAMQRGLHWVGVELEQKFVDLGQQNIDLWNERFGPHLPNWGTAVLLQGDSRYLLDVVGEAGGLISSPPYISGGHHNGVFNTWGGDSKRQGGCASWATKEGGYGSHPANLGNMPAGDPGDRHGVDAILSSPPYAGSDVSSDGQRGIGSGMYGGDNDKIASKRQQDRITSPDGYGATPGQLAAMPPGPEPGQVADGLVSSPPYEGSAIRNDLDCSTEKLAEAKRAGITVQRATWGNNKGSNGQLMYGDSLGQLGGESGPTFWSAAHTIVSQCYHVLKPGAVAVWVVKRFVRDKAIVEFSRQWADLCQSCGFELVHWHRAMLVEDGGTQLGLMGEDKRKAVWRGQLYTT